MHLLAQELPPVALGGVGAVFAVAFGVLLSALRWDRRVTREMVENLRVDAEECRDDYRFLSSQFSRLLTAAQAGGVEIPNDLFERPAERLRPFRDEPARSFRDEPARRRRGRRS